MLTALAIIAIFLALIFSLPFGVEIIRPGDCLILILAGFRFSMRSRAPAQKPPSFPGIVPTLRALQSGGLAALREFNTHDLKVGWISLWRIVRSVRIRIHRFDLVIATNDPAQTGVLYGSACAISSTLILNRNVHVTADFTRTTPDLAYRVEFSFIPWVLLLHTFQSLFTLPLRKIVRVVREARRNMRAEGAAQHV
jgi:hypothetical protein